MPALSFGDVLLCRQRVKRAWSEGHNDVTGFLFTTIGMIYAVVLAFLIFRRLGRVRYCPTHHIRRIVRLDRGLP